MKARADILRLASELGAECEVWADGDNSYTVEVIAPDGMEWIESGCSSLVTRIFTLWPETKKEAFDDIITRMKLGLRVELRRECQNADDYAEWLEKLESDPFLTQREKAQIKATV